MNMSEHAADHLRRLVEQAVYDWFQQYKTADCRLRGVRYEINVDFYRSEDCVSGHVAGGGS